MSRIVVDSSAVVAAVLEEPGGEEMARRDGPFLLSAVNLCEVLERLAADDRKKRRILEMLEDIGLVLIDFTPDLAATAARLKAPTRSVGLSLGDRACLALALREQAPVLTGDRAWSKVDVGVEVVLIR
ncbi:type II toxin-antitoxin system VapC family toxin [Brevundimonas sp.]|uniref:type II toxin-antitoxin system VapC family toxin n=1 Tax=Brevundimonas sp. TaxID=1871086 RepID=UPI001DAEB038|nr:type II toxin-antitoxin system VapC family toxin [Brevundimonas sp.]MBA4000484.1 PIN domain-containing protein [Brevundimonas sp.]